MNDSKWRFGVHRQNSADTMILNGSSGSPSPLYNVHCGNAVAAVCLTHLGDPSSATSNTCKQRQPLIDTPGKSAVVEDACVLTITLSTPSSRMPVALAQTLPSVEASRSTVCVPPQQLVQFRVGSSLNGADPPLNVTETENNLDAPAPPATAEAAAAGLAVIAVAMGPCKIHHFKYKIHHF